jgi:hypothetical protein
MKAADTSLKEKLENLADKTGDLMETGAKLAILEVTDNITKMAGSTILMTIALFLVNFLFLFLGFGVAYWISEITGDLKTGFLIVAGFYLLLILVLYGLRKKVIIPFFRNVIIKKIYE